MSCWSLLDVAETGDASCLWSLWKDGVDVEDTEDTGWTPLMVASKNGHLSIVDFLLGEGAEVDKKEWGDGDGKTALAFAAMNGHLEVVQALVSHEADVNKADKDGKTPTWLAARNGHAEVAEWLQEMGGSKESNAPTRLMHHCASERANADTAEDLVEECENDVNARDSRGRTALMYLCAGPKEIDVDTLKLLAKYGADVNAQDNKGQTPLMLAAMKGDIKAVELLLSFGADMNITDKTKRTAIEYASERGHRRDVQYAIEERFSLSKSSTSQNSCSWVVNSPLGFFYKQMQQVLDVLRAPIKIRRELEQLWPEDISIHHAEEIDPAEVVESIPEWFIGPNELENEVPFASGGVQ
ncbi:hypothetical protein PR002_g10259 [Phytophthora rubi]|uniref:Uncharacterized protein n=1 Tax=Phytophthora rubi TaxID=129364 RepID=A0A6A3MDU2_9STRA|nr:hypothetical protein PR002_g10259 [Phytophthora rubi]